MTTTYADWQESRECGSKVRHASRWDANLAVLQVWRRGDWASCYRCGWCDHWHLTSRRETT